MPPSSFYAKDDVEKLLDEVPQGKKSEAINEALRQYFRGQKATRATRIAELEERLDDIDNDIGELNDERREVEQELESLRAAQEAEEQVDDSTEEVVALFEDVVTIEPDNRINYLAKTSGRVPDQMWQAILDEVDIHYYDEYDDTLHASDVEAVVEDAGLDDSVLGDGLKGNSVDDGDAAEVLAGLTDAERDEVVRIAESTQ